MTYAVLTKKFCDRDDAIHAYKRILEINPDDARIQFGAGKYLLSVGDANGVKALEKAMKLGKQYVDPACRLISEFTAHNRKQTTVSKPVRSWAKAG
jgi:tetratricopeptide (TPR) repeat protein